MTIVLPSCRDRLPPLYLGARERSELIRRIAEKGVEEGIEEFLRERGDDPGLRERVRRIREEIARRAEEIRRALLRTLAQRRGEIESRREEERRRILEDRRTLEVEFERIRTEISRVEYEAVLSDDLVTLISKPPPPTLGERIWTFVLRIFEALVSLLLFPIRLLGRLLRGNPEIRRTRGRPLRLPGGIVVSGSRILWDPRVRRALGRRARALFSPRERIESLVRRLLGREDYEEFARRILEREIESRIRESRLPLEEKSKEFARKLEELSRKEEEAQRRAQQALENLEREREKELRELERRLKEEPDRELRREVLRELEESGLLERFGEKLLPSTKLLERFGEIVFAEETRNLSRSRSAASGATIEGRGDLVREYLRFREEISHMDVPSTLLRARSRHPHVRRLFEEDVVVHREEREGILHVVLIFDRSGSMEEGGRIEAAKRAIFAVWGAVRSDNPSHLVDIIAMDTSVERVDLRGVWMSSPRGFTNTGAALRLASSILRSSPAEAGIVFLVTDGLPEAYTKDGEDVAGHPDRALAYALEGARILGENPSVRLVVILLEPKDPLYVEAAQKIARELDGSVLSVSPSELARTLLSEFDSAGRTLPSISA